jgi:hypothetical protein
MLTFIINVNYLVPVPGSAVLIEGSDSSSPRHADSAGCEGVECVELIALSVLNLHP